MKSLVFLLIITITTVTFSQEQQYIETDIKVSEWVDGSLIVPTSVGKKDLVIIIAGSGPTNRNGNQNFLKSNNLKKLAVALAKHNIASFRYDKRIVKQIKTGKVDVKSMRFEDFVNDAQAVITMFKDDNRFNRIHLAGHSQGSLVGMLALSADIDSFISIAGAGQNIGDVIIDQINNTARQYVEDTKKVIEKLKTGETTTDFPPELYSMFNLETQPFMISWMTYNPAEIINKIEQPILILNGTKDLQVSIEEAKLLAHANDNATLHIIDNMNHVLFTIEGDKLENSKSYNESFRELNPELIEHIVHFIKGTK